MAETETITGELTDEQVDAILDAIYPVREWSPDDDGDSEC